MAMRAFVMWPDPRLSSVCDPVAAVDAAVRDLWDDMIDTMEAMPGVGLAAPQIGVLRRLAVVDASDTRGQAIRMANPEILQASAELRDHEEASPNLPGVVARIRRPRAVRVRFVNAQGMPEERDLVGLWATSVQHQIDHLDGRLFVDRLSRVKRDMALRRAAKRRGR